MRSSTPAARTATVVALTTAVLAMASAAPASAVADAGPTAHGPSASVDSSAGQASDDAASTRTASHTLLSVGRKHQTYRDADRRATMRAEIRMPAGTRADGTVRFVSDGRTLRSDDVDRDGVARLVLPRAASVGPHRVRAFYAPSHRGQVSPSSSDTRTARVDKARSRTDVRLSRKRQTKGHRHPIRVHVRVGVSNGAQPHGRVRISTAGHTVTTKRVHPDGRATARLPRSVPGGHHRAHARYLPARPGRYTGSHGDPRGYRVEANPANRVWERLAQCESGGRWHISGAYYGGLQFSLSTWHSVGGNGYPNKASKAEQIKRGKILQRRDGWGAWPSCSKALGLR